MYAFSSFNETYVCVLCVLTLFELVSIEFYREKERG